MRHDRRVVRIIALILALLLVGGVIVGALFAAMAEAPQEYERDRYTLSMEYLEEEQALHVTQRLFYVNRTGRRLDRVIFYAAPNMLRRQSALIYEADVLERVLPEGYTPGGIDLRSVAVNDIDADYGFQGEDELYLRVACDLEPGKHAAFEFDYYLLLTRCGAFTGVSDTDVRLGAFYFVPGVYDVAVDGFVLKKPLAFTRWLYSDAADYEVDLTVGDARNLAVACVGRVVSADDNGDGKTWHMAAENVHEFALCFGRRYRAVERITESGITVWVLSRDRGADSLARRAVKAIEQCEAWFGAFPFQELTLAQSECGPGALNYPGLTLLPEEWMNSADDLCLRFCVAQQYYGLSAYVEPSADAWLSDSVSNYTAYLLLEAEKGQGAFLKAVNRDWVSALQITIPGGLNVTSDAELLTAQNYDILILKRGAVVLHELRQAMGLDALLDGLRRFYELGQSGRTLTEMDLVHCMDEATGGSWEDFLTDWAFNVGEYVNQTIDWLN